MAVQLHTADRHRPDPGQLVHRPAPASEGPGRVQGDDLHAEHHHGGHHRHAVLLAVFISHRPGEHHAAKAGHTQHAL